MTSHLSEYVDAYDRWSASERETSIHFAYGDQIAEVYTAERTVAKHLLENGPFRADELTVLVDDTLRYRDPSEHKGETIVAVKGTLPIGALSVKSDPRIDDYHSSIVSTYDPRDGETLADIDGTLSREES